jgi:hypothetical protein
MNTSDNTNIEYLSSKFNALNIGHTYGTLEDTMQVVNIQNKGPHLNTLERFHIYEEQTPVLF